MSFVKTTYSSIVKTFTKGRFDSGNYVEYQKLKLSKLWQKQKIKRKCSKIQLCVVEEVKCALRRNQSHSIQFPISWEENLVNVLRLPLSTAFSLGQDFLPNAKWDSEHFWHEVFFWKRKGKMDSFSILIFTWDWTRAKFPITIFDASPLLRIRCSNFELWDGRF